MTRGWYGGGGCHDDADQVIFGCTLESLYKKLEEGNLEPKVPPPQQHPITPTTS